MVQSSCSSCTISLASDTLEELWISFRGEVNEATIECGGLPSLKHLDIRHSTELRLVDTDALTQLESITIESGKLCDCEWLMELPKLQCINLFYTVIDDFDSFVYPSSVKMLNLASVEINGITDVDRLAGLEYLNIYRAKGDIVEHYDSIRGLNIERLIISEQDKYHDYFRNGVPTNEAILWTNSFMRQWRSENSTLSPYIRKMYAGWTDDQIFEERFFFYLKRQIVDIFFALNPTSHHFTEYNVSIKKWFVQKMEDIYPFYDYSELHSQIATEENGYRCCVDTVNADGFNFVSDGGLFRVCYRRKDGKGINVRMLSMRDFMKKKRNHSQMWHYGSRGIEQIISKYIPDYDFDAQGLEIVFLDYYGTEDTKKLELAAVIAAALLHFGIHADNNTVFSGELNKKSEVSRWSGPRPRWLANTEFEKVIVFTTQKKLSGQYGSADVEKYTDLLHYFEQRGTMYDQD